MATRKAEPNPYDIPVSERPREKLRRDPSGESLSDAELLAIVLNTGTAGCPVFELAIRLLGVFRSLDDFVSADWLAMKTRIAEWNARNRNAQIRGVGDGKLLRISAAFLFERRARARLEAEAFRKVRYDPKRPEAILPLFAGILSAEPEKEHLFVLPIDPKLRPMCAPIDVSQGTITKTPVHPREVFCEATRYRARAVLVAHNHPDGDPEPSAEDLRVTARLVEAGRLIGIELLDHLVLGAAGSAGGAGFVSLRARHPELWRGA